MRAPVPDDDSLHPVATVREERYALRLSALLWLLGLPGVLAVAWKVGARLPPTGFSGWVLPVFAALQGMLMLAALVFFGSWLAQRVGLWAPLLQRGVQGARTRQHRVGWPSVALPGMGAGVAGAAWLVTVAHWMPESMVDPVQALPLWIKLLYVGVTETVMVHWGLMSTLLFALWRLRQPEGGLPHKTQAWGAIVLAAMALALLHLPVGAVLLGGFTPDWLAYVLISQMGLGLILGYIYWRHGLEAAIVAHILTLLLSHGLT